MTLFMYRDGVRVAELIDPRRFENGQWEFSTDPPILEAEVDYEIGPEGRTRQAIMILDLTFDGQQNHIVAEEVHL